MDKKKKEPIRNYKIWIGFGIIFALLTPWYFPSGEEPILMFGIPLWALVIMGVTVGLSSYITYVIKFHWYLEEDDEQTREGN
ncbi:hypothetical protein [Oceanobacillus salinisoli]|uniref:hypothetical protein n=1 Tax=Oceanobacillus salinisoli TaxID=2678611 RepID=UPI0012E1BE5D|nr:hypothetical protein [Oceanobacillus salinisoli]